MLADGRWQTWTNYRTLDDATLAAEGLLTSEIAVETKVYLVKGTSDSQFVLHLILDTDGKVTKG